MNRPLSRDPAVGSPAPAAKNPASGWRRAWLLLPALLCLSGACAPATPKTWRAEAQIMILPPPPPAPGDPLGVIPSGYDDSMAAQILLIQDREMARRTAEYMRNHAYATGQVRDTATPTQDEVQKSVKAANLPGTRLLTITAEATDPTRAKALADATAYAFVQYKQSLATRDMAAAQSNLEREAVRAGEAVDIAERQERLSRQAAPSPVGAARLRQNTEIAKELYRRLRTASEALRLQRDLVSGDAKITKLAELPNAPS